MASTSVWWMSIGCLINAFYRLSSASRSSRIKAVASSWASLATVCLLGTLQWSPALFSINTSVSLDLQNNKCHIFGRCPATHWVNCVITVGCESGRASRRGWSPGSTAALLNISHMWLKLHNHKIFTFDKSYFQRTVVAWGWQGWRCG